MNERENLTNSEKAYEDYISGMTYQKIADKYDVSLNTVKSWKKRYKWTRSCTTKKVCTKKSVQKLGNILFDEIKADLLKQLESNGTYGKHYEDLISDYMSLWNIKNRLIEDIKERGVSVDWNNGKQHGKKKNDSISELNKTSAQMLKILSELELKPLPQEDDNYDI
ncbi:P27 family phage terminase small subunit [Clostridium botulinum]|uniref:P27 family phage terminase small subunit n=1 Tax=Clostridium botulinum TaxID=1491 RepID=UPI000597E79C|nr:P27 family phage terminase small subunit [Clostridium botulinum]KIL06868.1 RNA polymerase sigma 70 [Clostridium botulinum]MBY6932073.1 P27 family phage terminase small subunit [Clostridium botulinum]MBY6935347.1 P27 family phage terminase small subunit [Clostridium botulinum]NFG21384.1 RNA polymerase subunit sigma-70 [Clostridium botulinum]NFL84348.1 RNA polymerase subunit sigma-70 [Clostridium botulinum]